MAKQKRQVQIKMCGNNGNPFIAKLHNVLLGPDLNDGLSLIMTLMNLGYTFFILQGFLHGVIRI